MVNYARIQHHLDRGRGIAAKKLGQPFLGYRITGSASGDFPGGWTPTPTASFSLFRRRLSETKIETNIKATTIWYDLIGNMEPFLLGDVFVQNDPPYVAGKSYGAGATILPGTLEINAIALAWHPPVNKSVGGRLDRLVSIYRPNSTPLPTQNNSQYWETTHDDALPLVLTAGRFAFGAPGGQGSLIPAGFGADHRRGEVLYGPNVPGIVKPGRWFAYVPPLPGYTPAEGDALITQDGARYVVTNPYRQESGVVGSQLLLDRKIAQAA